MLLLLRKAEDVAGACAANHPVRPDEETNEGSVVQVGRGPGADGTKQAAARGGYGVAAEDARPAQDVKIDIAVTAEPPSKSRAGESQGDCRAAGKPRHLLLRRLTNAGNVFQAHLSWILTCSWSWLREGEAQARTGGSAGDEQRRKRLREFAKKAIPLDWVLHVTLSAHASSYRANAAFAISMAACRLAFFADFFSAVLLINSTNFAVEWHYFLACVSSASMMLVPYLLLVSFNKLSAYALLAVPLPLAAALIHGACSGPPAAPVIAADTLDHIFDVSSAVNNIATGGGLTGTIFGYAVSSKPSDIPDGPLGFLLFFTICLAVYLMLVTTVRPPVLTRHAEPLSHVLLLLLAVSALMAAVDFLGWLACTAFSIDAVEYAVSAAFVLAHGAANDAIDASRRKEQQLLSAAVAAVVFAVLMKLHSRHAVAPATDGLGLSEILRMLLYLAAFLWSLNRMVFLHVPPAGGAAGAWARVWSAVELSRSLVVILAILDVICNLAYMH